MNNINNNLNLENQSLQELQKIKDERLAKSSAVLSNIKNSAKGVAVNALETVGDKLGIDIKNPQGIDNALDNGLFKAKNKKDDKYGGMDLAKMVKELIRIKFLKRIIKWWFKFKRAYNKNLNYFFL